MSKAFSRIYIVIILVGLITGGFLVWRYWGISKEKVEVPVPEEITEKKIDKCKDIQDLENRDKCYFDLALETKEASYCQRISSWYGLVSSGNCLKCVAASKNDLSLCPEKEFCPKYVFLQNTELCSEIKMDMIAMCRNCYLGDLTGPSCNLEKSKINKKEECIKKVAIETGDFELCKKIDTGPVKYCQDELAIKLNKPEMCDSTSCLDELAVKNKDVKLCDNRKDCILSVALSSNDSTLCEELSEKEFQEECYRDFGIEIGKKGSCELCEEIPNPIAKRYCMLKVTATSDDYVFCEGLDINIEGLVAKYTDEEFNFSFYYPKSFEISRQEKGTISITKVGPYDDFITITKYMGRRVEDSDAKFGKVAYWYDENKNQWMKDDNPVEPTSYTVSGLPIFPGVGRWATNIVALSKDKFLIINISGSGWTRILDPLTKTIIKVGQEVEDKNLKKILMKEILSSEEAVKDETAAWKIYKNEKYGFEIKYPSEWAIIKEGANFAIFADEKEAKIQKERQAGEIRCAAGVRVYNNEKGLSLYDWAIEKWGEPEKRELGKISEVKINDLEGINYEFMSMGIETNILFSKNNKIIDIQTTFDGCPDLHTIFNQMLSTFRFLE